MGRTALIFSLIIISAGIVLRFSSLDRMSFWTDELQTIEWAHPQKSSGQIIHHNLTLPDQSPPLLPPCLDEGQPRKRGILSSRGLDKIFTGLPEPFFFNFIDSPSGLSLAGPYKHSFTFSFFFLQLLSIFCP